MYEQSKDDYLKDLAQSQAKRGIYNSAYSAAEEASVLDELRRDIELQASDYALDEERNDQELAQWEKEFEESKRQYDRSSSLANKQTMLGLGASFGMPFLNQYLQTGGYNPLSELMKSLGFSSSSAGSSAASDITSSLSPSTNLSSWFSNPVESFNPTFTTPTSEISNTIPSGTVSSNAY